MKYACAFLVPLLLCCLLAVAPPAAAQDPHPGEPDYLPPADAEQISPNHFGSSPFDPPEETDTTFVVDQAGGLDTGCTFRSGGPLIFSIPIDRVVGDVQTLLDNDLIPETVELRMPAFDVDFDAVVPPYQPERDRVSFNGNVVQEEWLTGSNNVWKLNSFSIPIDWVEFPPDPGAGGTVSPVDNEIRIDIDTANSEELWCTAIDWASLSIEAPRPVIGVHGILSSGSIWTNVWQPRLEDVGILVSSDLDMGNLDSIGSNAAKVAAEVAKAEARWGVDKVNLVSHSKGGLDSRHFVEDDDRVDQLVQLGTPNAGSPLADLAQAGSLVLVGPLGTTIVNLLAGPAGVQLTTPYMAGYNLLHGSNAEVTYAVVGGDYDPDCFFLNPFCRPLERLLLSLTGPGDTIVPLTSAFALPYTANFVFATSGADKESTHSGLHSSDRVFDLVSGRFITRSDPAPAAELQATAAVGGTLAAVGDAGSHAVPVDEADPVLFALMFPGGDVSLELVTPSGVRIDPAAAGADPDLEFDSADVLGGRMSAYSVAAPEIGVWTVEVEAISLSESPTGYAINAYLENPSVTLAGGFVEPAVAVGQALDLEARLLEDDVPLPGAAVTGRVALPDGTTLDVALLDDGVAPDVTPGDGLHTGRLLTTQPGLHRTAFIAEGTSMAGAAYSRQAFGLATVSASTSGFVGTYDDFGRDTDGNGLYEELVVAVDLDITTAATYRLFGVLEDSAGNRHDTAAVASLGAGPTTLELVFDGERLYQNRVDGPYTLASLELAEEDDPALLPVASATDAHATAAYAYGEFEHAAISLTGGGAATGLDTDGNGLYDLLQVELEIEVDDFGFYQYSAQLQDGEAAEIGFDAGSAFLDAGVNTITLLYDGEAIGAHGVDGPYHVTDLLVFGAGADLVAGRAFTTQAFSASEFEGFAGDETPPTISVELSPDTLWPVDHKMDTITATVTASDDSGIPPTIELVSVVSSEPGDGGGDGDTEVDIAGDDLGTDDRSFELRAERAGTGDGRVYTATYRATDAAGNSATASTTVVVPHDKGK